jgi:hypothetical protein
MKFLQNIYVRDFLLSMVYFLDMFVWFCFFSFIGAFTTVYAPLAAMFVLGSPVLDRIAVKQIRKIRGRS